MVIAVLFVGSMVASRTGHRSSWRRQISSMMIYETLLMSIFEPTLFVIIPHFSCVVMMRSVCASNA
jgi:hypothetical protein